MNPRKKRQKIQNHLVAAKVDDDLYRKLCQLLENSPDNDMSSLIRTILKNRPIKIHVRDFTLDDLMEELSRLRNEIRHIGININQITKNFNRYPEPHRKAFYAKMAFQEYLAIEPKIGRLLEIITDLAKKWLPE